MTVIGGFIWLVMGAAIAGEAAARDVQMRMYPLIFTTPVTKLLPGRTISGSLSGECTADTFFAVGCAAFLYLPGMDQRGIITF